MDTPCSEKTAVELARAYSVEKLAVDIDKSPDSVAPSLHKYETGIGGAVTGEDEDEDECPDGGRGWLVVLGCVIVCAVTVGWGYVFVWMRSVQSNE